MHDTYWVYNTHDMSYYRRGTSILFSEAHNLTWGALHTISNTSHPKKQILSKLKPQSREQTRCPGSRNNHFEKQKWHFGRFCCFPCVIQKKKNGQKVSTIVTLSLHASPRCEHRQTSRCYYSVVALLKFFPPPQQNLADLTRINNTALLL